VHFKKQTPINVTKSAKERYLGLHFPASWLLLGAALCCQFFLSVSAARGQGNIELRMNEVKPEYCDQRGIEVTVLNEDKHRLDRQSVVRLHDLKRDISAWQTTSGESFTNFCNIDFGTYDVEVNAVGYLASHNNVYIDGTIPTTRLEVVLHKDPTAVDLNGADDLIPSNVRKEVKRAVYDLKSGNLKDAQKRLDKVYKAAPSSGQVNFLSGYLFMQLKDFEKAETYLSRGAELDPRKVQTLTLLGRVQLQREHYDDARKTLEHAVEADSGYWMAHNLLADAYLRQKEYEKAQIQAQIAIDEGKGAATAAQLTLGQALANVGRDEEGVKALNAFLQASPNDPIAPQVKALIAEIGRRETGLAENHELQPGTDLALAAPDVSLPDSSWGPPSVDSVKPLVAAGVPCPYNQVIEMSGLRVKQLVDGIDRFAATEDLLHEQLDQYGNPITKETRKFDYVASITESHPGFLAVDEYRNLRYGFSDLPDRIVTTGFVTLALIFHPDMRENFEMICEGLGDWRGQATWLVHFQQRADKPSRIADFAVGTEVYPINLKGRAWVSADTFHVVRIESELVKPIPLLPVQHQIAEYAAVHFPKRNIDLWLPQSAEIFFQLNRHRYYRRHSFDHYMLFSVNSEDKPTVTKNATQGGTVQNP
jgi:tetratricopeptide (TPR) repeat protein